MAALLPVVPSTPAAAAPPNQIGRPEDPGRGLVYQGLRRNPGGPCGDLFEVEDHSTGHVECTHGPDPAPLGTDVRQSQPPVAEPAGETTFTEASPVPATGFACYEGGGTGGARVQLIYAYAADKPNRFATYANSFQTWAGQVDAAFNRSAQETGHQRHVRFVTDAACKPSVKVVQLTAAGDDSFSNTLTELRAKGHNLDSRKYLVWVDATVYCGLGDRYDDDSVGSPSSPNYNNGRAGTRGMFARVDSGCWGLAEAHELMHTLGGVQFSAPHATAGAHCWDDEDLMCYDDAEPTDGVVNLPGGGTQALTTACGPVPGDRFDCNHDDYFHPQPVAGSYLATHWNTASSASLATWGVPDPPRSVSTEPSEGQVKVTWTAPPSNGGSPVTSYKMGVYDGAAIVGAVYSTPDATITPHTFSGLTNGKTYTVQVQAVTALGASLPRSATVTPKLLGVAIVGPTTVGSPVVATFTETVKGVTTSNYNLKVEGTSTALSGSVSCQNSQGTAVSCATGPAKTAKLVVALVPGQHYVATIDPAGATAVKSTATGNAVPTNAATFRALNAEETVPTKAAWATVSDVSARGGSYTADRQPTAEARYRFSGTAITWYTITGPDQGVADVYVDNVLKLANVNNYAPARAYNVERRVSGLTAAAHTLRIVVKGTKGNGAATDTRVSIDALKVGDGAVLVTPAASYGWRSVASSAASGGRYIVDDVPGAEVSLTFRGTRIVVLFMRGPDSGQVTATLDTTGYLPFDLYSASPGALALAFNDLPDTLHTIKLAVAPSKNPSSTGRKIGIDRWEVG